MRTQSVGGTGSALVPGYDGGLPVATARLVLLGTAMAFVGLRVAGVSLSLQTQAGIYLVGMVAMNLPHGGFEHFANLRRRGAIFQGWYLGAYLGLIAFFLVVLFVAPVAGLALAIGVAMAKGGLADVHAMAVLAGDDHLRSRSQRWLAAAVRGGVVMAVPMVVYPETFYTFSSYMVSIFEPGALAAVIGPEELAVTRPLIGGVFAALAVAHVGIGARTATGSGAYRADVLETLALIVFFVAVPVIVAVGLYFPFWYSARQVARETAIEDDEAGATGEWGILDVLEADDSRLVALGAWGVLVVGALATFGLAALVWTVSPNPLGGATLLPGLVAFWSIFISVIALPHVVIGGVLDRTRGIWYVP